MHTAETVTTTVAAFTTDILVRLTWQAGQIVPGLDAAMHPAIPAALLAGDLRYSMEPQEWLRMALYGAGLLDADAGEVHDICQSLAEWLFAVPGLAHYRIPPEWSETPLGNLWWRALLRAEGDELITLTEAAQLLGIRVATVGGYIDRGRLAVFVDASANQRQGRRLVRRSEVEALRA